MGTYSMDCEVLQQSSCESVFPDMKTFAREKIKSVHKNHIVVHSSENNIIPNCPIKTHDSCVARVKFLQETSPEMTQLANILNRKNVNDLQVELGHPSNVITQATAKSMGINVTFKSCKSYTRGNTKRAS